MRFLPFVTVYAVDTSRPAANRRTTAEDTQAARPGVVVERWRT
jgi:hypothetical protein